MKIVLFISCLSGGGAERVVSNLANYLKRNGHHVTVLSVSTECSYPLIDGVKWVKLCSEREKQILPHFILNTVRMLRLIVFFATERTDVYLTFLPVLSHTLLRFRKLIKAPVILSERNDPKTFYQRNKAMMDKYYPRADAFVFQTADAQSFYEKNLLAENARKTIIPNAINEEFVGKVYSGIRTKRVVSAGRLNEQKNYQLLIDAFARFDKIMPGYQLIIYGEGPQRSELEKQIAALSLENKVLLPGRTDHIIEAIQDASLFVLPSNYEGMPNALAEAMALGLPCIATDCPAGGSRFLISHGVNGIVIPVGDLDALVEAMCDVIKNPEYANTLSANAIKVADILTATEIYSSWERYIREVVSSSRNGDM